MGKRIERVINVHITVNCLTVGSTNWKHYDTERERELMPSCKDQKLEFQIIFLNINGYFYLVIWEKKPDLDLRKSFASTKCT